MSFLFILISEMLHNLLPVAESVEVSIPAFVQEMDLKNAPKFLDFYWEEHKAIVERQLE